MKIIRETPNKNLEESNRVDDFKSKSKGRFFATISGFVDKSLFTDENGKYDEQAHKRYNERNTHSLENNLKRLGLEYQKTTGAWDGETEKSFIVWNTAYTWDHFQQIMLKLNELFTQWGICIGRATDKGYQVSLWETESLEKIDYKVTKTFTTLTVSDALKDFGTILTRKIYDKDGKIDPKKTKDSIKFEALQKSNSLASSDSLMGAYKRKALLDELLNIEAPLNNR